jgi:NADH dehydrogenase (ubiquinone) 1 alpha subcomplex subunit 9
MVIQVQDVAQAMANITQDTKIHSTTFNLPGPVTFNHAEMQKLISLFTFRPVSGAPEVPKRVAVFLSKLSQLIWWPSLSPDEIERRFIDDVMVDAAQDWAALGVDPVEVEKVATPILRRYRSGYVNPTSSFMVYLMCLTSANYVRPVVLPGEGRTTTRSVSISLVQRSCSPNEALI